MPQRCPVCGGLASYLVVGRDGGRRCEECHGAWYRFQAEHGPEAWDVPDVSPAKVLALFALVMAVVVALVVGLSR